MWKDRIESLCTLLSFARRSRERERKQMALDSSAASVDLPTCWEVDNREYSIDDENQWKTCGIINDVDAAAAADDDEGVHHRLDDELWCDSVACLRSKHRIKNLIEVFLHRVVVVVVVVVDAQVMIDCCLTIRREQGRKEENSSVFDSWWCVFSLREFLKAQQQTLARRTIGFASEGEENFFPLSIRNLSTVEFLFGFSVAHWSEGRRTGKVDDAHEHLSLSICSTRKITQTISRRRLAIYRTIFDFGNVNKERRKSLSAENRWCVLSRKRSDTHSLVRPSKKRTNDQDALREEEELICWTKITSQKTPSTCQSETDDEEEKTNLPMHSSTCAR